MPSAWTSSVNRGNELLIKVLFTRLTVNQIYKATIQILFFSFLHNCFNCQPKGFAWIRLRFRSFVFFFTHLDFANYCTKIKKVNYFDSEFFVENLKLVRFKNSTYVVSISYAIVSLWKKYVSYHRMIHFYMHMGRPCFWIQHLKFLLNLKIYPFIHPSIHNTYIHTLVCISI